MGILDAIRAALGLRHPISVIEPEGPELDPSAEAALARIRSDETLHLRPVPSGDGHLVTASVRALSELPDGTSHPLHLDDPDERLNGLVLHHEEGRWFVRAQLELRGEPTPNPDGRLLFTNRVWVRGRPQYYERGDENLPPLARRLLELSDIATVLFRENTVTVRRTHEASWRAIDDAVEVALREYLLAAGLPLPEKARSADDGELIERARAVLAEQIGPAVAADGGDIDLIDIADGVARVRMTGACDGCPASTSTLQQGVKAVLVEAFPESIREVLAV